MKFLKSLPYFWFIMVIFTAVWVGAAALIYFVGEHSIKTTAIAAGLGFLFQELSYFALMWTGRVVQR